VAQSTISRYRQFGNPEVSPRGTTPAITRNLTLIPQRGANDKAWCTQCQSEVHVVRLHLAHHFLPGDGQDPHKIEPVACLHHLHEDDGSLLICLDSLLRQYQQGT
jgi:hypothetical protein